VVKELEIDSGEEEQGIQSEDGMPNKPMNAEDRISSPVHLIKTHEILLTVPL